MAINITSCYALVPVLSRRPSFMFSAQNGFAIKCQLAQKSALIGRTCFWLRQVHTTMCERRSRLEVRAAAIDWITYPHYILHYNCHGLHIRRGNFFRRNKEGKEAGKKLGAAPFPSPPAPQILSQSVRARSASSSLHLREPFAERQCRGGKRRHH